MSFTVCLFVCVCTVTDFSAEDKASVAKFCSAVHRRPIFVNFASQKPKNQTNRAARGPHPHRCSILRDVGSACADIGQCPLT